MAKCTRTFVVLATLMIATGLAAQTYSVTRLEGLGGGAGANSINDRGWIAGAASKTGNAISHAALWVNGEEPIDLGALGGPDSNSAVAWPVKSNNGLIVGSYFKKDGAGHNFVEPARVERFVRRFVELRG